ncbi:MAG: GNAT family N-acetyltransferase [Duncaniella sp.]|nr:GNAT family N-acetyltransferase [Duncaniella sp.]
MILETERLRMRCWSVNDASDLYNYAKDDRVGPIAGWPPHRSVSESREIIETVFAQEGVFALTLKNDDTAIGCIGLIIGSKSNFPLSDAEGEISYWLGVPFWGLGLVPEAMREIIRYGFEDLGLNALWCGYFDGNEKSKRVQEKCGFRYHHTNPRQYFPLINEEKVEHVTCLTREEWENARK